MRDMMIGGAKPGKRDLAVRLEEPRAFPRDRRAAHASTDARTTFHLDEVRA